jgi:single-strand DNA-binding protein
MNCVHLGGRLTGSPRLIEVVKEDGQVTCKTIFSLALNEKRRKEDGEYIEYTTYVDCVAWDSGARLIDKFFHKGKAIIVHGKIRNDNYTKRDTGEVVRRDVIRVTNFEFPLTERHDSNGE